MHPQGVKEATPHLSAILDTQDRQYVYTEAHEMLIAIWSLLVVVARAPQSEFGSSYYYQQQ